MWSRIPPPTSPSRTQEGGYAAEKQLRNWSTALTTAAHVHPFINNSTTLCFHLTRCNYSNNLFQIFNSDIRCQDFLNLLFPFSAQRIFQIYCTYSILTALIQCCFIVSFNYLNYLFVSNLRHTKELKNSYKDFLYTLHLASSNTKLFCNHGTIVKSKKLILVQCY